MPNWTGIGLFLIETGAIIRTNASIRRVQKRVVRRRELEAADLHNFGLELGGTLMKNWKRWALLALANTVAMM